MILLEGKRGERMSQAKDVGAREKERGAENPSFRSRGERETTFQ